MHPETDGAGPAVLGVEREANRIRLAVIADLAEENWPSMDLVAEMLYSHLRSGHDERFETDLLQPPMRRRATLAGSARALENIDRLWNRMYDYPRWLTARAGGYDAFHIADHSYAHLVHALPPGRAIVTCHDLDTFRCLLKPEIEPRPRWFRAITSRILAGLRGAAHVVCDSRMVCDQILAYGLLPAERVSVVPLGVHPAFGPDKQEESDLRVDGLLAGTPAGIFLLHVGSTIPRKRIDVLLHVVAGISRRLPAVRLIRVGGALTEGQRRLAGELRIEDRIVTMPFLDRSELASLYRRAALVLQPSEAEGFGLPVVEAMACGAAVLASDIEVFREIAGDAAVYCPLEDIPAWVETACGMLSERAGDPPSWMQRRIRCQERAARYRWSETAASVAAVHRRLFDPSSAHGA